jgi:peptide/nickel transport system permease protein
MLKFALRRVAASLLILLGTTVFIYALLLAAPGGPEQKYANNPRFTKAQQQAYVKALGLDQPVPVQYCRWLGACRRDADGLEALIGPTGLPSILPAFLSGVNTGIVHGDFGYSYENGNAVSDRIGGALLPTLILAGLSAALWLSIAVVLGVVTALRNGGLFDNAFSVFTYVTAAFPTFILGFALISIFSVGLGLTPVSGMTDGRLSPAFGSDGYWVYFSANPGTAIADLASHLILPVVTLVTISVAGDARYVRQSVIESMGMEHVRTARSKGLSSFRINRRHILRTGLIPFATNIGLAFPFLVSGALITETIFSWPGVGRLTLIAINTLDYPLLMGILSIGALAVAIGNLISDLLYAFLDPRVRL